MVNKDWAQYIEARENRSKPRLLIQWQLKILQELHSTLDHAANPAGLASRHQVLITLGEWWQGQNDLVFRAGESSLGES
jgi:hypothetical protein